MRVLSIDQSMASCAYTILEDGVPIFKEVLHTTGSGTPKPWQVKFDHPVQQMQYIADKIAGVAKSFKAEYVVLESLSFGSAGNATRDLAGLFFIIQLTLLNSGFTMDKIHTVAPTSVKSWARNQLPGQDQEYLNEKGKMVKIKMGKDEMMKVCEMLNPGFLDGYTKSGKNGGSTDLADAYLIGRCFIERMGFRTELGKH
ncbi:hypothetical protein [Salmonella phage SSBI34]|nr:hypothetical protein [Salmonella phage SSBI34]